jgi:hypothetical protein
MKGLKLDTKKLIMQTAGNAAGLVAVKGLNKIGFVNKQKPVVKALITILAARIGLPFIASKMGMSGKKGGDFINGAEEALATVGVAQLGASVPMLGNAFPTISGYEDNPYQLQGLGLVTDDEGTVEDNGMNGYEENPYSI